MKWKDWRSGMEPPLNIQDSKGKASTTLSMIEHVCAGKCLCRKLFAKEDVCQGRCLIRTM